MALHTDKLVGVTRAVRPQVKKLNAEQEAIAASARPKPLTPQAAPQGNLVESLAWNMREQHFNNYLGRLARVSAAQQAAQAQPKPVEAASTAKPASPVIQIHVLPGGENG